MVSVISLILFSILNQNKLETLNFSVVDMDTIWGRKPVYVSYWAIWCTNCVKELDEINKVKDSLGIFVVAINEDGEKRENRVIAFVKGKGWNFPVVMDKGQSLMKSAGVSALPTSFLYSKEKKLLKRFTGFSHKDLEGLKKLIAEQE